jgi:hypothetical protein
MGYSRQFPIAFSCFAHSDIRRFYLKAIAQLQTKEQMIENQRLVPP